MNQPFTKQELKHLLLVLRQDLKDRTKRIRMASMQTSDEDMAVRIGLYQETVDLLRKVEIEYQSIQAHEYTKSTVGDDDMFEI